MAKTRIQEYTEQFADTPIRFTPYALKKTGLIQSQALLKIEDYTLICAPFQLSMQRGIFLVVLSSQEIAFFQQFQKKICSINLTFQKVAAKKPLNLFLRGALERVGPVKGRQNVCMMDAAIRSCPNDLVEIIGDFLTGYHALRGLFDSFKGRSISVSEASAKVMRFNNYAELLLGTAKVRATVLDLSVDAIRLRLSMDLPGVQADSVCSVRLYFQIYQFSANARVTGLSPVDRAGQRIAELALEFSPELVEIIDDYWFRQSIQGRKTDAPSAR